MKSAGDQTSHGPENTAGEQQERRERKGREECRRRGIIFERANPTGIFAHMTADDETFVIFWDSVP